MGGCASRPKASEGPAPEELPAEGSSVPESTTKEVQAEAPQEVKVEEEKKEEAPLVDLSEPKPDDESAEPKPETLAAEISELKAEAPVEAVVEAKEEEEAQILEGVEAAGKQPAVEEVTENKGEPAATEEKKDEASA